MNTNNTKTGVYFYGDESHNFNFATSLSMSEKVTFINLVVNTVVGNNYHSILRNIMFDFMLIKIFTDIETSFLKVVDDDGNIITNINLLEKFLEETNIVDVVKVNMDVGLLEELNKAVDKAIEYRTGIHPSPLNDALASLLSTLEKKVNEFDMGSMMGMAQKFMSMTEDLTPESLVDAYMNSDIYKNNIVEIEEAKKHRAEIAANLDKAIKAVKKESGVKNDTSKKSGKSKK